MACNGVVNAMRVVSFTCRVMITDAILSLFCHSYNAILFVLFTHHYRYRLTSGTRSLYGPGPAAGSDSVFLVFVLVV